jgi:hypothetical protein
LHTSVSRHLSLLSPPVQQNRARYDFVHGHADVAQVRGEHLPVRGARLSASCRECVGNDLKKRCASRNQGRDERRALSGNR